MPLPKIVTTKIIPPRPGPRTLDRPRVTAALGEARHYRLTLLHAGAGFGKSTALAALAHEQRPAIWYQITEEDTDSLIFLLHLVHATRRALPDASGLPVAFLEGWDGTRGPLPGAGVIDQYLNALNDYLQEPVLVILDDAHLVLETGEIAHLLDRLIGLAPQHLHFLLAGRPPLQLPNLARWRSQGEVLLLDQSLLAFRPEEIGLLFARHYGYELTAGEVEALAANTEGWAIALQLIWQNLRGGLSGSVEDALARPVRSLEGLFDILAREVFDGQPADVQAFLRVSATLREMTPEACDAIRSEKPGEVTDSAAMLAYLRRQDLFVVDPGDGHPADGRLRYHHIFHRFLQDQATPQERHRWHLRAAAHFQARGELDAAVYHLLQAPDLPAAALLLDSYGAELIAAGRLEPLAAALDALPPDTLQAHPDLLFYLGELARLHSRFQEALGWYRQAEVVWREQNQIEGVARALRGQARVYLDTVNPSRAEEILQQALRLSDGSESRESQARLYELLAENKLNSGHIADAERLRQQADTLRSEGPSDSQLLFRVLLRTGRLAEARRRLETRLAAERREPVHTPRAHRETLLILSLVYAFMGEAELAYQTAWEGTRRGIDLGSPFVTAVGYMRQGHALMLRSDEESLSLARQQFLKTIELSRQLAVPRLLVEAYWGLCRAAGFQGDLPQALQVAQEGIEIASQAGDEWIASLVRLAMGASLTLAGRYEAAESWLSQAARGFQECSDLFAHSAARLWLCLGWFRQKKFEPLAQALPELIRLCEEGDYHYLLDRPTLLGPPDERSLVPMFLYARRQGWHTAYLTRLLDGMGLPGIELHPGFQLRITTLGGFQVRRGLQLIPANGWRREKARQLFQILLTYRDAPLDRDQLLEYLWPDQEPGAAQRSFKVTLNTLYQVLEPDREPGSESAFILREGSAYALRPEADLWLDAREFTTLVRQAESAQDPQALQGLQQAVDLYQGEYLPEARYETWAAAEREHLAVLFLRAADRLSEHYLNAGQPGQAIDLCQRILAQDDCWERAYRHLMLAYHQLGDHGQVARTYQRCLHTLRTELDVSPSGETEKLFEKLTG